VRIKTVVASVAKRNQVSLFGDATSCPGPDVMYMKLNVNVVLWAAAADSATVFVAFNDAHPQFWRRGSLHRSRREYLRGGIARLTFVNRNARS
jgi:hypothetical protein